MEEAHKKLAHMLAKGGLLDMIKELASMPFQQLKAKLAEFVGATQTDSSRMEVHKQEGTPEPSKESGRGAMQYHAAQHPNHLKQQRTRKITGCHEEVANARPSIGTELCVDVAGQIELVASMRKVNPTTYCVRRLCPHTSTSGTSSRRLKAQESDSAISSAARSTTRQVCKILPP